MRYLYYCNSAYQILTVMNLHWHRKYASFEDIDDYAADLMILNSFNGAERISQLIRENKVFDKVILINKAFNSGRFHALQTLTDVLSPLKYLSSKYGFRKQDVCNRYAAICVPKYSTVTAAIWRLNRKAELHILEDGAGTYFGSMRLTPDSTLYRKYYQKLNHGRSFYDYASIYLNDADLYTGKDKEKAVSIPDFSEECLEMARSIFAEYADCDDVDRKSILYFAQFLNNKEINIFIDSLLEYMEDFKEEVLYIPHPRHKDEKVYDLDYANQKQIWELKQLKIKDLEEKMLISIHSTACFTPKILFDKEPYVLLFYKLCDDKVTTRNDRFDAFVDRFVGRYRDKEKILIPETVEEFKRCIERFIRRNEKAI